MKKRLVSLLLLLTLCFSMLTSGLAYAAETDNAEASGSAEETDTSLLTQISQWALKDLIVGDTYGIYPQRWYEKGMTAPIRNAQVRVLLAGIRNKLLDSDCVVEADRIIPIITNKMTVEEVLKAVYATISSYIYIGSIGLEEDDTALSFMAKSGIYTGNEGELSLSDICSVEQACVIATRTITYIYNELDSASKGFLWEAKTGENTVYMLGSIHMASYDIYPFSNEMLDAYAASNALVVELNILDPNGTAIMAQYGIYNDGTTLADHVSEEVYNKTVELAAILGYSPEQIVLFKPWFLDSLFSAVLMTDTGSQSDAALAAGLGIDLKFIMDSIIEGKPLLEIEGYEGQAQVIDSFSDELEESMLISTLDAVYALLAGSGSDSKDSLDDMLTYWHYGDVEAFMEFMAPIYNVPEFYSEGETEKELLDEYMYKMFTQRDIRMADYIDSLLQGAGSTTYLVVLGSGHFISEYDILDILAEKGYEINQIK